jgi:membrane protein DedA with SNARE-associated domain
LVAEITFYGITINGSIGVFIGTFLEEIIAPIPSALVIMGASFFLMQNVPLSLENFWNLFIYIVIPATIGLTLGSLFVYLLTYFIGKPVIDRTGKYLGISWDDIKKADRLRENYADMLLLFILRAVPIIPSVAINAFCGLIKFEFKRYIIATVSGTLVRATILGFIGWQFGSFYQKIAQDISNLEQIVVILIIVAIVGFIIYKKRENIKSLFNL